MIFRNARRVLAITGAALLLASCGMFGDSAAENKATLVDALRNLLETKSYTSTYTLQSDTESLVALSEGELSEEAANKILDSTLEAAGNQADNPEDSTSQLVLNVAGTDTVEMRFVEGDLYFRAEVRDLVELFGGNESQIDFLLDQVANQPGFEWAEPAAAGEWIVIRDALDLSQQMGGMSVTPGQQEELVNDLLQTVEQNATVTDEGEDDAGQHLRASLPLKETTQDLLQSLGPAAGMMQGNDMLSDIPDEDLLLDFWIQDDTVSQLGIDFTQFEGMEDSSGNEFPEGVEELSLLVAIEEAEVSVEAVDDAIELDATALTQALTGLATGGAGGAEQPGGFDCDQLKGAPLEVTELYAEECPELQK